MVQSILSNLAIILLGHLLMEMLMNRKRQLTEAMLYVCVPLLFSAVIITMFYLPITISGFNFDLRLIPLVFLACFRGWRYTLPTLVIACTWRYFMGGVGMMPGIVAGMVAPTLFVLAVCAIKRKPMKLHEHILLLTICWFISDFPIVFIVPNGWQVFQQFVFIRYTSFLIVAFIYYTFIQAQQRNWYYKSELERLAWYDQLTNLLNRRKFFELLESKPHTYEGQQYIALIDIDHFKQVNDTYGHAIGDAVLMKLAALFTQQQSSSMQFARYGGEEFIVYVEAPTASEIVAKLERLRQLVATTPFAVDDLTLKLSISIGMATLHPATPLKDTIRLADERLYRAKQQGRNCLVAEYYTAYE